MRGLSIQDLHFGIKDTERLYDELSFFKQYLKDQENIDIVNINGDYFHRKLLLGETASLLAINFFNELVAICKQKKIKIRMIQGTRSHDLNQLHIFDPLLNDPDLDFKMFFTVAEEEINGIKILYIPEEYPENVDEYYEKYRNKTYDIIHGHGTWDFTAFKNQIVESKNNGVNSAPVFIYNEWKNCIGNGCVLFGHIHERKTYKNKIFYSGSYTRWGYGERSDRGFIDYSIDDKTKEYKVNFINNELAPKYDVLDVNELIDTETNDIDTIEKAIDIFLEGKDNVRLDFNNISVDKGDYFKNKFSNNPNVKVEIKKSEVKLLNEESAKTEPFYEKYKYILEKQLPQDQTIKKFVKDEYDVDLNLEDIREQIIQKKV